MTSMKQQISHTKNNLVLKWLLFILIYVGILILIGLGLVPFVESRNRQFQSEIISEITDGQDLGDPVLVEHPSIQRYYQLPDGNWLLVMNISLEYRKEQLAILFNQQGIPQELRPLNSHALGRIDRFFPQGIIPRNYQQEMGYRLGRFYQQLSVARIQLIQGVQ